MTDISEDWRHLILVEYAKDTWALGLIDGSVQDSDCTIVNELIIYKGIIYLVLGSEVRRMVLRVYHESPMARHLGFYKTYRKIHEHFSWKGLKAEVLQYVRECPTFQQNKQEHSYPAGLL